ncbi:MAG TPA: Gfo/Idh/MocA family oxidoreductase [Bryobacteraceae bacterium]|nr:Gfo/Idh/MocA family oxidoreductase [Bryobacteraceae bacterium]
MNKKIKVAVVGVGEFGRNHVRVVRQSSRAELVAVVDKDAARARDAAAANQCAAFADLRDLHGKIDAAVVAVPTSAHAEAGCELMEAGIDVLVEKPITPDLASADRLIQTAERTRRILQVGHLERFNPAVMALETAATLPLFFEIHRLSVFSPRSLDVDVVLDLMIHDLDILLSLVPAEITEIRAAGISILTGKVDIANVRLEFHGGCVANLTASRVSTERVRKLRLFQPSQYISLDYGRQDGAVVSVGSDRKIGFSQLPVVKAEPLVLQFESFLDCVESRQTPKLSGEVARRNLEVALAILAKIEEHSRIVAQALVSGWKP